MGQVSVTLNNRTYRLACNDGEEPRLSELARDVKTRVETLAREFGQPADERILLMAAVLLADELMDLREAHEAMLAAAAEVLRDAAAEPAAKADDGKAQPQRTEAAKTGTDKPGSARTDAVRGDQAMADGVKTPPRAPQQNGGGSSHPAMPQAQAKNAKNSAA